MKQLVIISGKGGTGKTTVAASFAALSGRCVLVDADVDAANLHLIIEHEVRESDVFMSGKEAVISQESCAGCGMCRRLCRFDAISPDFRVDPLACEGCGVCARACPAEAITMIDRECGRWFVAEAPIGAFVYARLDAAAENSGKLVSLVREKAGEEAGRRNIGLVIVDGPPGVGCPVIASMTGGNAVLIVTEATASGLHDLKRAAELSRHFKVPTFAVVNKADLHEQKTAEIEAWCRDNGITAIGRIPFDPRVVEAMTAGKVLVGDSESVAAAAVLKIWNRLCSETGLPYA